MAHSLGLAPDQVPMPSTPVAGWKSLAYYDPPAGKGGKAKVVGHFPCVVFGTAAPDGRTHAHRIYVAERGSGLADLGADPSGKPRVAQKSARRGEGQTASGCAVLWGAPAQAQHLVLAAGIETAAALAFALEAAISAGQIAVAAATSASGMRSFHPWPKTQRITVAADRDEKGNPQNGGYSADEKAARAFALKQCEPLEVRIALPGEDASWLDVLRTAGVAAVRAALDRAAAFVPTTDEKEAARRRAVDDAEQAEIEASYPLPAMDSLRLSYRRAASGRILIHKYGGKEENENDLWRPVATPFGVPARLNYQDQQGAYGLRAVVQAMDGHARFVDFDRAALARMGGSEIRARLFAAGLRVEGDGEAIAVQVLKAADPAVEVSVVSRPGWHQLPGCGEPVFVSPAGEVIGCPPGVLLELAASARLPDPTTSGSMDGWRTAAEAAIGAPGCPHWTIGLVSGFAGCIVALTSVDTCGMDLSGFSSSGKTLAQMLAVSAWSCPCIGTGLLQSMRTTENALENLAQASTGTVLALDEVAHVDGRTVGRMIYSIASGVGKSRLSAEATLKERYAWQTFVILSSECGLEAKVRGDGGHWSAGMAVRIADVDVSGINRAVPQDTLDAIAAIKHHFGHAGPAFVRGLIRNGHHREPDNLRREINRAARYLAGGDTGSRVRAAHPFALLLIAGDLAQAFDVLPGTADVRDAVLWGWHRFLHSSEALALDPIEQAIATIRTWIAECWNVTIKSVDVMLDASVAHRSNNREAAGWYDQEAIYIPTGRIREAAGNVLTERQIAQGLDVRGLLVRRHDTRRIAIRRVPRVGSVDAYALRRSAFVDSATTCNPDLQVHEGGLR